MLPFNFPKWRTGYDYWQKWSAKNTDEDSLLEAALKNGVGEVRQSLGRNAHTTLLIVDAQSIKNTDTAEHKGLNAGKRVSGIG
ncbi:MAG: hypothetical protein IPL51_08715 [Candidatus Competibacteraceae bacterium]|nr:hypothetical protein [Candidatus Competibacteraceae bacterium]